MTAYFSINKKLSQSFIHINREIENLDDENKQQVYNTVRGRFKKYSIAFGCWVWGTLLTFWLSDKAVLPILYVYLIGVAPMPFLFFWYLKLNKETKKERQEIEAEIKLGKKEVYTTHIIATNFHSNRKKLGSYYVTKFEGFSIAAIVHESQLPQLLGANFRIERLPQSGTIIAIKRASVN